jgi:hypothetical protein
VVLLPVLLVQSFFRQKKAFIANEMLESKANKLIRKALRNAFEDKDMQLQTNIHPELLFRFNSINLLVARRGVGKTFNVLKELIKLSQLPGNAGFSTFLYVSDKVNDATVNELIKLVKLKVRQVNYKDVQSVLEDIIDAKSAYGDVLEKGLQDEISDKTREDLFNTLDIDEWWEDIPHTAVLLDDAINILKESKFKGLQNLLFQNRQPRLTIFICVQDIFGVPVKIRRNCDAIWVFAGMTDRMAFGMMCSQLGLNAKELWGPYQQLPPRGAMIVEYGMEGQSIKWLSPPN